jgi:hypothetical protein
MEPDDVLCKFADSPLAAAVMSSHFFIVSGLGTII